jgi:hypothetical protein
MTTLKFSDGVTIETGGPMRIISLGDGYYVVGNGWLIAVDSWEEGEEIIAEAYEKGIK